MGLLFESLGLLATSEVVSCSASDFVTGYVNQASGKTREVFAKAVGGVLFIDEAYRCVPWGRNEACCIAFSRVLTSRYMGSSCYWPRTCSNYVVHFLL